MKGKIEISLLVGLSVTIVGMVIASYLMQDKKAQAALDSSAKTAYEVTSMKGALDFLVRAHGGEYDKDTGMVVIVK